MRAPFRHSPIDGDPEDFAPPEAPALVAYPSTLDDEPVLYGPKGEPLYRRQEPFGFRRP